MNLPANYPVPAPRLRSSQPGVDIPGFFSTIEQYLTEYIADAGYPGAIRPVYSQAWPKERLKDVRDTFDIITYRVVEAKMAPTSNDKSRIPRAPIFREQVAHPSASGYLIERIAWDETVTVEFSIWSKDNSNADNTTNWFHKFLVGYCASPYFKLFESRGIQKFTFINRKDDDVDHTQEQEIYRRRLVYEFRLQTMQELQKRNLTDLSIYLSPSNSSEETEITVGSPLK